MAVRERIKYHHEQMGWQNEQVLRICTNGRGYKRTSETHLVTEAGAPGRRGGTSKKNRRWETGHQLVEKLVPYVPVLKVRGCAKNQCTAICGRKM